MESSPEPWALPGPELQAPRPGEEEREWSPPNGTPSLAALLVCRGRTRDVAHCPLESVLGSRAFSHCSELSDDSQKVRVCATVCLTARAGAGRKMNMVNVSG